MISRDVVIRIDELIIDDGYTTYDQLESNTKEELTALAVRSLGKDAYEVLTECNDAEENISDLIFHLLNGTTDSAWRLADTLRDNAVMYCARALKAAFIERVNDLQHDRYHDEGLRPVKDATNGETRWAR